MKANNLTIDLNNLDEEDLEFLQKIVYRYGTVEDNKQLNKRIAFIKGWLSAKAEAEYLKEFDFQ